MSPPAAPVVGPVPGSTLAPRTAAPGSFLAAVAADPDALLYFLVNVGDGDTQLLVLPPDSNDKVRRVVVVDVATPAKLPALLSSLHDVGLIEPVGTGGQVRLLVATHPHFDHIGGMADFLDAFGGPAAAIVEFWDPGYFFPTPSFHNVMTRLESSPWIRRLQPSAGMTMTLDALRLTVLGPGMGLRNRFDTYGVEINDSSITVMVEFPAGRMFAVPTTDGSRQDRRAAPVQSRRLLLGGDAQFTSWAQAAVDFPDLQQTQNLALAKELRSAIGRDYLSADVIKVSHHASKHGVNLELLERVGASIALVSSVAGGGKYGFPHLLAMEAVRESRQATTTSGAARRSDQELGIHVTGSKIDDGTPAGSIGLVVSPRSGVPMRMFRFGDAPAAHLDLTAAREVIAPHVKLPAQRRRQSAPATGQQTSVAWARRSSGSPVGR